MRSTAADHMKWASSAPTKAQMDGLLALIKEARADDDRHEVTLPCGSKLLARKHEGGGIGWVITDGISGAVKSGTLEAGKRL